jgi:endonuclease/exonuclease/phosphatase family metal-dependent hydrolase
MTLKLINLNIEGNKHLKQIIPFIQKESPDIVTFQEVFAGDLPELERRLKLKSYFFPLMQITQPNAWSFPLLGRFGLTVLTRLPVESIDHQYYRGNSSELPEMLDNPDAENRILIWIKVKKDDQIYTVATTHFVWAMPEDADAKQAPYLNKLLTILKPLGEFVLAGDFNAPRGQKTFNTLASIYKDNIPSEVNSTLDPVLHRAKRNLVVDGLFTTPGYRAKNVKIVSSVSDHKAIVAEIDKL